MNFSPAPVAAPKSNDPLAVLLRQRAPLVLIETHEEHAVVERLRDNDLVLIKGSRGSKMDIVARMIEENADAI